MHSHSFANDRTARVGPFFGLLVGCSFLPLFAGGNAFFEGQTFARAYWKSNFL